VRAPQRIRADMVAFPDYSPSRPPWTILPAPDCSSRIKSLGYFCSKLAELSIRVHAVPELHPRAVDVGAAFDDAHGGSGRQPVDVAPSSAGLSVVLMGVYLTVFHDLFEWGIDRGGRGYLRVYRSVARHSAGLRDQQVAISAGVVFSRPAGPDVAVEGHVATGRGRLRWEASCALPRNGLASRTLSSRSHRRQRDCTHARRIATDITIFKVYPRRHTMQPPRR